MLPVAQVLGDVVGERNVAAELPAQVVIVEQHNRIAVHAVKLKEDTLAVTFGGHVEASPIPPHTGGRKAPAYGFPALRGVLVAGDEGQIQGPVMRQVDLLPGAVIKIPLAHRGHIICFRKSTFTRRFAKAKVEGGIRGMAQVKSPAVIQQCACPWRG